LRAQIANEFMVAVGLAIIVMLGVLFVSMHDLQEIQGRREMEAIRDVGFAVQNELFLAAFVQDGYVRTFELPQKNAGIAYSISLVNDNIVVRSDEHGFVQEFTAPEVVGNIAKGSNTVRREGGVIHLN
jgi:hypothetical protein